MISDSLPSTVHLERCVVVGKRRVAENIFLLTLESRTIASLGKPGNFVNIRVCDSCLPLWRRPFSLHDLDPAKGQFEILFNVVGRGTRLLGELGEGAVLDVLGPLGNHFPLPPPGTPAVLVAGGLGIAPLLLLARHLRDKGTETVLLYGARTKNQLIDLLHFRALGVRIHTATDDGSAGTRGNVVDLFKKMSAELPENAWVYTCGPTGSLVGLARSLDDGRRVWASLETSMACGFGACMGCAVKARKQSGYFLVCKDGPVFDLREVELW